MENMRLQLDINFYISFLLLEMNIKLQVQFFIVLDYFSSLSSMSISTEKDSDDTFTHQVKSNQIDLSNTFHKVLSLFS